MPQYRGARGVVVFALLLLQIVCRSASADGEWEFNAEQDGITVYIRDVEGSDINEIKAVGIIGCSTDQVWEILHSEQHRKTLYPNITETEDVETCGELCTIKYTRVSATGIDDRHYFSKNRWSITAKDGLNQYAKKWEKIERTLPPLEDVDEPPVDKPEPDGTAMVNCAQIAETLGYGKGAHSAIQRRLSRFRRDNPHSGWHDTGAASKNKTHYLYEWGKVKSCVQGVLPVRQA